MPADLSGNEFLVEELDAPDGLPITLSLRGRDAPLGGRGSGGAFDMAPALRQAEFYYPGSDTPTRHLMGTRWDGLSIKGNLQDRFGGRGHARAVADRMLDIQRRKLGLRISWGPYSFLAVADKTKISPETPADINYELTFSVDGPEHVPAGAPVAPAPTTTDDLSQTLADHILTLRSAADGASAQLDAETAAMITGAILATATVALDLVDVLGPLAGMRVVSESDAGRVIALAGTATGRAQLLREFAGAIQVPDVGTDWTRAVDWQASQAALIESCRGLESVALATAQRLAALTTGDVQAVYYARQGDTVESVARTQLQDADRAADLARINGLSSFRLAPGQRLVLPR